VVVLISVLSTTGVPNIHHKSLISFSFLVGWNLNSGLHVAKQVLFHLSHTSSPFCSGDFGDGGLLYYLLGLASNHDPPDLSLPNS
jgi:hypothetical protein